MKVLASGYPSLDHILPVSHSPDVGSTALIRSMPAAPTFGGCGANVAVALQRLGQSAGVGMVIGGDPAGEAYRAYLDSQHVDVRNLIVLPDELTSVSYLFRNPQGEYQNFFYPGAADAWHGDLTLKGLQELSFGLITVAPFAYNRQFVALLKAAGVPLIWQLKPDIFAYPRDAMIEFARRSQIILMNRIEADFLCTSLNLSDVRDLISKTTQMIVVTRGADGVCVYTRDVSEEIEGLPVEVVDPVGAGDGFTAGFIAGMLNRRDPGICARWGTILASFVLEKVGCQTNLPDKQTFFGRYKEHFGPP